MPRPPFTEEEALLCDGASSMCTEHRSAKLAGARATSFAKQVSRASGAQ